MHYWNHVGLICDHCRHTWALEMPDTQPELVKLVQDNKLCPVCQSKRVLMIREAA